MGKAALPQHCVIILQIHILQHSLLYAKKCLTLNVLQSFDMNIVERPARYVQRVVTDLSDNHVMYQTPAHNTVLESHKIQDFQRVGHMSVT